MKRDNVILFFILLFTTLNATSEQVAADFKTFEIVIPSYNNAALAEKNLTSVCFQNYPRDKYHVTYVNDASTDGTGQIVADFIARNKLENHVTLINNATRRGQLENRFRAFHKVPDNTIIAECDGDDFYENDDVLNELNAHFKNSNTWMMYQTIVRIFPSNKKSEVPAFSDDEIMYHWYRDFLLKPTWPVRAYYAWLFKQVKLKDLLYEGKFFPVLTDPAYMIPMLEMAGTHNQCLHKILYVRNRGNPIAAIKTFNQEFRKKVYDYLHVQEPYELIENCDELLCEKNRIFPIDVCACCKSELAAEKMLALVAEKFTGVDHCTVLLESSVTENNADSLGRNAKFSTSIQRYDPAQCSLHTILIDYVARAACKYVVLLSDHNACINRDVDLKWCSNVLDACFAKILYVGSSISVPHEKDPSVEVRLHLWAHQFKYEESLGKANFSRSSVMCCRELLLQLLKPLQFATIDELHDVFDHCQLPINEVGLCFDNVKDDHQCHFVIATASYNNEEWVARYLQSVFSQKYKNFRVIYCDDSSTDKTLEMVAAFAQQHHLQDRLTLLHNTNRLGPHENYYNIIHSCRDDEVIVIVDGDDCLYDENVLTKLANVYNDRNVWITYGQYQEYPSGTVGISQQIPWWVIEGNSIRLHQWVTSHLRTFYAWLYKRISRDDLQFEGRFVRRAGDYATMFPMIEMAGFHSRFIATILYILNRANPNNYSKPLGSAFADVQERHRVCEELIKRPKYQPLIVDQRVSDRLCGFTY